MPRDPNNFLAQPFFTTGLYNEPINKIYTVTFLETGTITFVQSISDIRLLIVGGGGSGGDSSDLYDGNGGTGGQVVDISGIDLSTNILYPVIIGLSDTGSSFGNYNAARGLPSGGGSGYQNLVLVQPSISSVPISLPFYSTNGSDGPSISWLSNNYYGGSGAGGGLNSHNSFSKGGLGGGANGVISTTGSNGTDNTGGGGGGGSGNISNGYIDSSISKGGSGGSGGSGIVILQFTLASNAGITL
jgi:hypothetical protein